MGRYHDSLPSSPAEAGVQERAALQRGGEEPLLRSGLCPGLCRGAVMKPINAFPLIMLLIAVLFLVYWLRPH
jgi:hypothetical protein